MKKFENKLDAISWAKNLIQQSYVIVDFETTDKPNPKTGYYPEPCQIAIVDHNGNEIMNTLIKPKTFIREGAFNVHGISNEMVRKAPQWSHFYDDLKSILHGKIAVAYNASFEQGVTNAVNNLYTLPLFTPKWECAMLAYSAFREVENDWRSGYKWHKLGEACEYHGIKSIGAHDALVDVNLTLELIKVMANG